MNLTLLKATLLTGFLALCCSCAPQSGHSDDCGPNVPVPEVLLTKLNNQPAPTGLDLPVQRAAGTTLEVTLDFSIQRNQDWCMRGYSGPLTFTLPNLPSSISRTFDPAVLPSIVPPANTQGSRLLLSIPASTPDGNLSIVLGAQETSIHAPAYRLILSTH